MPGKRHNNPAPSSPTRPPVSAGGGQVRIIGGHLKRSVLTVAPVEGLRPSPDRVRETLFNWLGQDLTDCHVLDAFAGSGVLGLECLSRGATHVDFCETHGRIRQQLQANCSVLLPRLDRQVNVNVHGHDVCEFLRGQATSARFRYDLALLDPPFRSGWLEKVLPSVWPCMTDSGRIYIEWHASLRDDVGVIENLTQAGWHIEREQRAGLVHFHLLGRKIG